MQPLNPAKKAASLWGEFRNFAFKGNVIDLAVGVIIGAAFGGIIKSLVDNIIMPVASAAIPGEHSYKGWTFPLGDKAIPFGLFLADVVNFLILAAVLFFVIVKFLGWIMRSKEEEAKAPPPLTKDQELLIEIRDLLQRNVGQKPAI